MKSIETLYQELDEWNFEGEEAMLWWRDDDAVADSAALQKLLEISSRFDAPVCLAVIPDLLEDSLVKCVRNETLVQVLQHGISHSNHAPIDAKKQELISVADMQQIRQGLMAGAEKLSAAFTEQSIPVLVPPWNRIDKAIVEMLPQLNFLGLSCFGPRKEPEAADNVWVVNSHMDIINWKNDRQFVGEENAIDQLVEHLRARRTGVADLAEPTGIMTHHLVHDAACNAFLQDLFAALDDHPAATLLSADRVFQTRWRVDVAVDEPLAGQNPASDYIY